jgi:hypothetical protein
MPEVVLYETEVGVDVTDECTIIKILLLAKHGYWS